MENFLEVGAGNPWLFIPAAIVLGALHGLEPGHSKTMMAAFIVAIRGTPKQAVLLGLSAAFSHTLVVWIVALAGLHFGAQWDEKTGMPYFNLASSVIIVFVAVWMMWRTWLNTHDRHHHHHDHDHDHGHGHGHHHDHGDHHHHDHDHEHDFSHAALDAKDAHARAHANDIKKRFDGRTINNMQIMLFGLTGGLIPCPAAITVLLLCLQVKKFTLGAAMVMAFSVGLALTLVMVGVVAALGSRHMATRWDGFEKLAARAPYISGALIMMIGLYLGFHALIQLQG